MSLNDSGIVNNNPFYYNRNSSPRRGISFPDSSNASISSTSNGSFVCSLRSVVGTCSNGSSSSEQIVEAVSDVRGASTPLPEFYARQQPLLKPSSAKCTANETVERWPKLSCFCGLQCCSSSGSSAVACKVNSISATHHKSPAKEGATASSLRSEGRFLSRSVQRTLIVIDVGKF
ncbi:hypothetical protein BOX15_Mlig003253g1 [Macrostomum lignano]|uniref:Uncharacterized protein n=2 Tax=Macrostomum lignano TaxID=282301 RepID=A0A1I8J127_9PLAT|nr:hypothetical protein BOX15_Mlig003253g1 [Macrostomum lignano]